MPSLRSTTLPLHAPRAADAPVRLVQLTDAHLYDDPAAVMLGVDTDASLRAVLAQIGAEPETPDLLLATGDLSQDGSAASYERLRAHLSATGWPVRCLPGNHDAPEVLRQSLGDWTSPITDIANWRVVTLDSTIAGADGGHLDDTQLDLLSEAVESAEAEGRHVLVALHHNLVQIDANWHDPMMVDNPLALFRRVERSPHVRLVLWGHVHQEFDCRRHNLRMLATPSTCFQFTIRDGRHAIDPQPAGYRWIKLYGDGSFASGVRRLDASAWQAVCQPRTDARAA